MHLLLRGKNKLHSHASILMLWSEEPFRNSSKANVQNWTQLDFKKLRQHATIPEAARTTPSHSSVTLCQIKQGAVREPSGNRREIISATSKKTTKKKKGAGRVTADGETRRSISVEARTPAAGHASTRSAGAATTRPGKDPSARLK